MTPKARFAAAAAIRADQACMQFIADGGKRSYGNPLNDFLDSPSARNFFKNYQAPSQASAKAAFISEVDCARNERDWARKLFKARFRETGRGRKRTYLNKLGSWGHTISLRMKMGLLQVPIAKTEENDC